MTTPHRFLQLSILVQSFCPFTKNARTVVDSRCTQIQQKVWPSSAPHQTFIVHIISYMYKKYSHCYPTVVFDSSSPEMVAIATILVILPHYGDFHEEVTTFIIN